MSDVLVIGSGGREHAISWKLLQSPSVNHVYICPGNGGTATQKDTTNINLDLKDYKQIKDWCKDHHIALVVIGPEDPICNGLSDYLNQQGFPSFGPSASAARLESSKAFSKSFMDRHGIPTARWQSFTDAKTAEQYINCADFPALVVKASGLAAGKGVLVCSTKAEAIKAVYDILDNGLFGKAGQTVVVEELLEGPEVSALAFTDGKAIKCFPFAQDHKQLYEGNKGPNTGGMGAYAPCYQGSNIVDIDLIQRDIIQKTVDGMSQDGNIYKGVLYAGLMITPSGPKVLEYNCRFGDPETQVLLPLLKSDFYDILQSCCHDDRLVDLKVQFTEGLYAVGVVCVSEGYPASYPKGFPITGLDKDKNDLVFHAGTKINDQGDLCTNGGRVLATISLRETLPSAATDATKMAGHVQYEGRVYRKDIAFQSIKGVNTGLTYTTAGVNINAGDELIQQIKPLVSLTSIPGCQVDLKGFGGVFDLKAANFVDPLLVSGTDGVGTKLKIAQECGLHDTIGLDLVAMCVNDIIVHGAKPLYFLDYYACGRLDVDVAKVVIKGIVDGCRQAECALIGGETAEMPGMYNQDEYDLAGFAVGAVEREKYLPSMEHIKEGDLIVGVASSGIHSNGYSLVRKIVERSGLTYNSPSPFEKGKTLGDSLIQPTQIYVNLLLPLIQKGLILGLAHITGGGLPGNISRVLPSHLTAHIDATKWTVPPVFGWLSHTGGVKGDEMGRTFNCGLGMCLIVDPAKLSDLEGIMKKSEETVQYSVVGKLIPRKKEKDCQAVIIDRLDSMLEQSYQPCQPINTDKPTKTKVAVLISGTGTNLQSLIDSTKVFDSVTKIALVISNKPSVKGLERAKAAGIPSTVINHKDFPTREQFDDEMDRVLDQYNIQIVCLAGFMRILSGKFVNKWQGKLLNVHPSLLPSFKGSNAHRLVLEAGVRLSGCTVHFVSEEVDCGAIIAQECVQVFPGDTEETLAERVKSVEHKAYPKALDLLARKKVQLVDGKCKWNL